MQCQNSLPSLLTVHPTSMHFSSSAPSNPVGLQRRLSRQQQVPCHSNSTDLVSTTHPNVLLRTDPSNISLARSHARGATKLAMGKQPQQKLAQFESKSCPRKRGRKTTLTSPTVVPAMSCGQTSGLAADPTHNESFSENKTKKVSVVSCYHIANKHLSESTKAQGGLRLT